MSTGKTKSIFPFYSSRSAYCHIDGCPCSKHKFVSTTHLLREFCQISQHINKLFPFFCFVNHMPFMAGRIFFIYVSIGIYKKTPVRFSDRRPSYGDILRRNNQSLGMVLPLPTDIAYGALITVSTYVFASFWKKFITITSFSNDNTNFTLKERILHNHIFILAFFFPLLLRLSYSKANSLSSEILHETYKNQQFYLYMLP